MLQRFQLLLSNTLSPRGSGRDLSTVIQNTKCTMQIKKKTTKQTTNQKTRPEAKDGSKKKSLQQQQTAVF